MKLSTLTLTAVIFISGFCKSQTAPIVVTGSYIGQSLSDRVVMTLEVNENNKYVLKTYSANRELQKETEGRWTLEADKLVLEDNSGTKTALEKYRDIWYIADKNGVTCLARFYQNRDPNEFWEQLIRQGC